MVGEQFFDHCAQVYIQKNPSQSRELQAYGANFANFIADFPPAKHLPYLSEVAQFDWGYHQVYYAADTKPFDIKKLSNMPEQQYQSLKFQLNPACKLFSFRFPILRIWQLCQQKSENLEKLNLEEGGIYLLVIRRQLEIEFETLSSGEYTLLSAFRENKTFAQACHVALNAEPELNITQLFNHHLQADTILDLS